MRDRRERRATPVSSLPSNNEIKYHQKHNKHAPETTERERAEREQAFCFREKSCLLALCSVLTHGRAFVFSPPKNNIYLCSDACGASEGLSMEALRVFKLNYLAQERVYANQVEYKVTCTSLHLLLCRQTPVSASL